MMAGWKARRAPRGNRAFAFGSVKGKLALTDHARQHGELFFKFGLRACPVFGGQGEQPRQCLGAQSLFQNIQMDADIRPVQRLDDFACVRAGMRRFGSDIRFGGGGVGNQMLTAERALIQRFEQVAQLGFGIGRNMEKQKCWVSDIGEPPFNSE